MGYSDDDFDDYQLAVQNVDDPHHYDYKDNYGFSYGDDYGCSYNYGTPNYDDDHHHHHDGGDDDDDDDDESSILGVALEKLNIGPKKKLLVLSVNGLLIHRAHRFNKSEVPKDRLPDVTYNRNRFVYKRPFLEDFMKFCLERFEVGIWSSAQEQNSEGVLDCAFKGLRSKLLFVWDQDQCTDSGFKSLENKEKPLLFKDLSKLWSNLGNSSRCGSFSESNTLLIDDKPYKGLLNPPNTGIYPVKYDVEDASDNVLDPKKELGLFLKGLADAEDVPSYVKDHSFGQPAVAPGHPDWEFYGRVLGRMKQH